LIYKIQQLSLYVLIALAIASGVEASNFSNPSSVSVGVRLAQAYSDICWIPRITLI
jgi:hypothetical protein